MRPLFILDRRWLWIPTGVLLLLMALIYLADLNHDLFRFGNRLSLYTGEWLWSNITLLGDTSVVLVLLLPFVGRRPDFVWAMLLSAAVVTLLVHSGKYFIDSPRPIAVLPQDGLQLIGYLARSTSFPSGHTAAAFTLAACLALFPFPRGWKLTLLSVAVVVGVSRVAVGIHWPLDVAAGALSGWLGAAVGCYLAARLPFGVGLAAQRVQAVLLVVLAVVTMLAHDGGYPQGKLLLILLPGAMLWLAMPELKRLFKSASMS